MAADENIIEADGSVAAADESMFGGISEDVALSDESLTDDQIDALQQRALEQYEQTKGYGRTWEFDFPNRRFVMRGQSVVMVEGEDTLAQWAMNVLHTERFTALVYSDDIGVEFEDIVRLGETSLGLLQQRVTEALMVHERIRLVRDFSAELIGRVLQVRFVIETNEGPLTIEGTI